MPDLAPLRNDCFAFDGPMAPYPEALGLLTGRVHAIAGVEKLPISEAAGRVLAKPVTARASSPPHNNAAVDGFAVRHADLDPDKPVNLPVVARAAAGHPVVEDIPAGSAVRIFTGAVVPDGLDTIFMLEDCSEDDGRVLLKPGIRKGANLRLKGEDIHAGTEILRPGIRLRPQELALAAAAGVGVVDVYRRLRVAVFSTGDEVYDPSRGEDAPPGGIFDANRFALGAMLHQTGCDTVDLGILPDRFEDIRNALSAAADRVDAIITSGGVSLGEEDHVKGVVTQLGELHHWRVAIKPGRPIAFGRIGSTPFVGLPGNPVAVMVTYWMFARPLLLALGGLVDVAPRRFPVRAGFERRFKGGRREWLRAWLEPGEDGVLEARCYEREGSGIINSLVAAEGLVEITEEMRDISRGDSVDFLPFSELGR